MTISQAHQSPPMIQTISMRYGQIQRILNVDHFNLDIPSTFGRKFTFSPLDVDDINLKDGSEIRNRTLLEELGLHVILIIR